METPPEASEAAVDAEVPQIEPNGQDKAPQAETSGTTKVTRTSRELASQHGVAELNEIRAWYLYDWANSPFYQVLDTLFKIVLKRIAELAEAKGNFWSIMSAGSYPPFVMWLTAAVQTLCLLTFSTCADYEDLKTKLLRRLTFIGSVFCGLTIFCVDGSLWPLAGFLRVAAGCCFILCTTFYDAYLPLLAASHYEVVSLTAEERSTKEAEVTDEMSAKGMMVGYAGGTILTIVTYVVQLFFECDRATQTCSDFQQLFFLVLCCSMVGLWWTGFALLAFRGLQPRPGPALPAGVSIFKLGWTQAHQGCLALCKYRHCGLFVLSFFCFSDGLNTILNLAVLVQDKSGSADSVTLMNMLLSVAAAFMGVFLWSSAQRLLGASSKSVLLVQLGLLAVCSAMCVGGVITDVSGGLYIALAPVMLTLGSLQAYSRSMFAQLIPVGQEAKMFALYVIMDKGSSLIGTLVTGVVHTTTGEYDPTFWYCIFAFVVGAILLFFVDPVDGKAQAGRRD